MPITVSFKISNFISQKIQNENKRLEMTNFQRKLLGFLQDFE